VISSLVILIVVGETVIKIEANNQLTFLNTRQFYADLEPAESRYKVAAKPVPYKPPNPAPLHFEGVTPTLPVVTKQQEKQFQETNNKNNFAPTVALHSNQKNSPIHNNNNSPKLRGLSYTKQGNKGVSKVSLKDFLENKKKQESFLEEENDILEQVKRHKNKASPKTKYETDTVIYPTTTYRPQTFHSSDIAKELGLGSYSDKKNQKNKKQHKKVKKEKTKKYSPSLRTLKDNRPSNYVEASNYKLEQAYGTKKNNEKKKEKSGRRLRLKKVRRKKKYNNNNSLSSGPGPRSNHEENSFLLKQKELKNKYQNRKRKHNSPSSIYDKTRSKPDSVRSSKKTKYEKNWINKQHGKKTFKYDKKNKLKLASQEEKTEMSKNNSFKDSKFSSSLFLEDSTGDRGTYKSIRRATKPPKYQGYDNVLQPIANYAAPADHYGGITAYNAILSEFAPSDEDYLDTLPAIAPVPITPNIGKFDIIIINKAN
jgi:hypothetical protein